MRSHIWEIIICGKNKQYFDILISSITAEKWQQYKYLFVMVNALFRPCIIYMGCSDVCKQESVFSVATEGVGVKGENFARCWLAVVRFQRCPG